jgi:CHRD domain
MKRFACSVIALGFLASACGDDSPSSPSSQPKPTFSAELRASNENPPITDAEATGTGNATVTFDLTRDAAGNVTAASATFVVNLSGFPPGTPIRIAHIHTGAAGVNGAIVVDTTLTPGENVTLANGSGSFTKTNPSADAAVVQSIINNPSAFYFNAHSVLHPGGVVRGQLARVQ